jgi:hypothetical protein
MLGRSYSFLMLAASIEYRQRARVMSMNAELGETLVPFVAAREKVDNS